MFIENKKGVIIEGFGGMYSACPDGRIWSNYGSGRYLKQSTSRHGYSAVTLCYGGARRLLYVHRLVARGHVAGYSPKLHVNHINGVKTDNRAGNLEWVTPDANMKHSYRLGLHEQRGEKNNSAKLTEADVSAIKERLDSNETTVSISRSFDVSRAAISLIKSGKRWAHVQ